MIELTATELPRFMACNGSYTLPKFPEFEKDDNERLNGNTVHWLIEQVHSGQHAMDELIDKKAPDGLYVTPEMVEHASEYLKDLKGYIEYDTSFSGEGYHIKGRADNVCYENGILEVKDFKYGWSIVEPFENWTLIAHAIGIAKKIPDFFIHTKLIRFSIYQPRPFHPLGKVRTWEITAFELSEYINKLEETMRNPSDFASTGLQCKHCSSVVACNSAVKAAMNAIDVSEKAFSFDISNEDLSILLNNLQRAEKVLKTTIKAYEDLTMHRLREGAVVNGYGLERSMSNRSWNETITPETIELLTGRDDLTVTELITPTQAIKKGLSEEIVYSLSNRKETDLKLCRVDPDEKVKKLFEGFDLETLTTKEGVN